MLVQIVTAIGMACAAIWPGRAGKLRPEWTHTHGVHSEGTTSQRLVQTTLMRPHRQSLRRSLPPMGLPFLHSSPGRSGTAYATPCTHVKLQVLANVAMAIAAQQPSRAEAAQPATIGQRFAPDRAAGARQVCLGGANGGQPEGGHPQGMLQAMQLSFLADTSVVSGLSGTACRPPFSWYTGGHAPALLAARHPLQMHCPGPLCLAQWHDTPHAQV